MDIYICMIKLTQLLVESDEVWSPGKITVKSNYGQTLRFLLKEASSSSSEIESLESQLQVKYAHVLDDLKFYYDMFSDGIFLTDIYIKESFRRQGWGSKIMDDLIKFADKKQIPISLIPVAEGIPTRKLIKFYKKHGFIENDGNSLFDDMSMYRLPKKATSLNENFDYEAASDYHRRRDEQLYELSMALKKSNGHGHLYWKTVSATLLKKVWYQFGKYHRINENDLDKIADQILTNIARLDASTTMMGHTSVDGREEIKDAHDIIFTDEEWDVWMPEFFTDVDGSWLLSDYGLPKLQEIYPQIFNASTPEEKLYACDKALNVVHQRSDLAAIFVEGGTSTLNAIAAQGGYTSEK